VFTGALSHRKALNLIDHLPRTSAYAAAVADDDEAATMIVASGALNRKASPPPVSEWSTQVDLLASLVDRIGELINATLVNHPSGKGKPARIPSIPRPVTAIQRALARRSAEAAASLEAQLFPPTAGPT
jgi:hypothetical protein